MWSFVHFLLLSQFHVVRHKYLIWLRYFMLFCIFANALWGKKLNTMAMERDMRWRLNFSHPTFPFPFPFPPFHYVGKVFLTAGLSLVNPSHYFDLFWCKCCSWIFDCLVQRQVYGSSLLSYCFFFSFCFQTDGSVPNTLVIANCEVVKPRVAAAEHISQVTHCFVMFLLSPSRALLYFQWGYACS